MQGDGEDLDHDNDEEVQAFIDAEEEALNEEERLLMDGPEFDHALQNAYQQGLEANNPDVNIPDVRLSSPGSILELLNSQGRKVA